MNIRKLKLILDIRVITKRKGREREREQETNKALYNTGQTREKLVDEHTDTNTHTHSFPRQI